MAISSEKTTQVFLNKFNKALNSVISKKVVNDVGKRIVEIERERITKNIDIDGVPFKAYTPQYAKWKAKYLSGAKTKGRRKAQSRTIERLLNQRGKYQAKNVNDKMRLTGSLLRSLTFNAKILGNNRNAFTVEYELTVNDFNKAKAEGLIRRGYKFLGMSRDYAWKQRFKNEIAKIVSKSSQGKLM